MSVPKYVGVKFTSEHAFSRTSVYYFKNSKKLKLEEHDAVIADTRYGIQLAVVVNTLEEKPEPNMDQITKTILEKIKSKHIDELQKIEKVKSLRKKMQERAKKMDEAKLYEMYAEKDPEMAAMLEEFNKLQK